ncbi:unnamed protein product [Spirodela intermedia]|uniref:Uncharacterized protein n=1 Tax=Spirodela intermedia TaxID=51605 RepID=A0A7I8JB97_SPIIN|nr:unnamed protein product [Spirodela intermedia]CAA6667261.1 unnamed protein product [Spirodela intermedia]
MRILGDSMPTLLPDCTTTSAPSFFRCHGLDLLAMAALHVVRAAEEKKESSGHHGSSFEDIDVDLLMEEENAGTGGGAEFFSAAGRTRRRRRTAVPPNTRTPFFSLGSGRPGVAAGCLPPQTAGLEVPISEMLINLQ